MSSAICMLLFQIVFHSHFVVEKAPTFLSIMQNGKRMEVLHQHVYSCIFIPTSWEALDRAILNTAAPAVGDPWMNEALPQGSQFHVHEALFVLMLGSIILWR